MSPRHRQSDPSTVKNHVIRLRVTEAEVERFKKKAADAGCRSISEYIRSRCIGEDDEHDKRDSGVVRAHLFCHPKVSVFCQG